MDDAAVLHVRALAEADQALSPRRIAPNQTLASSSSSTSPITVALSATQALEWRRGCDRRER
jgi:hypothetical protein